MGRSRRTGSMSSPEQGRYRSSCGRNANTATLAGRRIGRSGRGTAGYPRTHADACSRCSPNPANCRASNRIGQPDSLGRTPGDSDRTCSSHCPGRSPRGCHAHLGRHSRRRIQADAVRCLESPYGTAGRNRRRHHNKSGRILDPSPLGNQRTTTPLARAQEVRVSSFPPNDPSRRGRARKERECAHTVRSIHLISAA